MQLFIRYPISQICRYLQKAHSKQSFTFILPSYNLSFTVTSIFTLIYKTRRKILSKKFPPLFIIEDFYLQVFLHSFIFSILRQAFSGYVFLAIAVAITRSLSVFSPYFQVLLFSSHIHQEDLHTHHALFQNPFFVSKIHLPALRV